MLMLPIDKNYVAITLAVAIVDVDEFHGMVGAIFLAVGNMCVKMQLAVL